MYYNLKIMLTVFHLVVKALKLFLSNPKCGATEGECDGIFNLSLKFIETYT